MPEWLRVARRWASLRKRARRSALFATSAGSTLIATSRPSRVSRARYTSPIPPAPRGPRTSHGPRRVPRARDMATPARREFRAAIVRQPGAQSKPVLRGLDRRYQTHARRGVVNLLGPSLNAGLSIRRGSGPAPVQLPIGRYHDNSWGGRGAGLLRPPKNSASC